MHFINDSFSPNLRDNSITAILLHGRIDFDLLCRYSRILNYHLEFCAQRDGMFNCDNPRTPRVDFPKIYFLSLITFHLNWSLGLLLRWMGYHWGFQNTICERHALTAERRLLLMMILWGQNTICQFWMQCGCNFPPDCTPVMTNTPDI